MRCCGLYKGLRARVRGRMRLRIGVDRLRQNRCVGQGVFEGFFAHCGKCCFGTVIWIDK